MRFFLINNGYDLAQTKDRYKVQVLTTIDGRKVVPEKVIEKEGYYNAAQYLKDNCKIIELTKEDFPVLENQIL